jgi:hypothetical protein
VSTNPDASPTVAIEHRQKKVRKIPKYNRRPSILVFHKDTFKTCSNGYVTSLAILRGESRGKNSGSRCIGTATNYSTLLILFPRYSVFRKTKNINVLSYK